MARSMTVLMGINTHVPCGDSVNIRPVSKFDFLSLEKNPRLIDCLYFQHVSNKNKVKIVVGGGSTNRI